MSRIRPNRYVASRTVTRNGSLAIRQALDQLTPRQEQVVILRIWADLSVNETAEVLGVSEGTVKRTYWEAKSRLMQLLTEDQGDGDKGGAR